MGHPPPPSGVHARPLFVHQIQVSVHADPPSVHDEGTSVHETPPRVHDEGIYLLVWDYELRRPADPIIQQLAYADASVVAVTFLSSTWVQVPTSTLRRLRLTGRQLRALATRCNEGEYAGPPRPLAPAAAPVRVDDEVPRMHDVE